MLQYIQYKGKLSFVKASNPTAPITMPAVRMKMSDFNYASSSYLNERVRYNGGVQLQLQLIYAPASWREGRHLCQTCGALHLPPLAQPKHPSAHALAACSCTCRSRTWPAFTPRLLSLPTA